MKLILFAVVLLAAAAAGLAWGAPGAGLTVSLAMLAFGAVRRGSSSIGGNDDGGELFRSIQLTDHNH